MPCFKGLAVSIHTPNGPLPEYAVMKQARQNRINAYIPVPPPKFPSQIQTEDDILDPTPAPGGKPEQSTFAVSIMLLLPGQIVPYSQPKPDAENPYPAPIRVGGMPRATGLLSTHSLGERGKYLGTVAPYVPLTPSPHETIAAYIYFDGRPKEEVATLLRRGEETWVNSRWVSVSGPNGDGLAEREFLFREVGLERWLNGLDLTSTSAAGKSDSQPSEADTAAKIERRRERMERKRLRRTRRTRDRKSRFIDSDDDECGDRGTDRTQDAGDGMQDINADPTAEGESDDDSSSDADSEDDPVPESTGQIKVALYRVLASGEIRQGEYAPQFDANDGDEVLGGTGESSAASAGVKVAESEDVDHTTSFAKPKTLDPQSISTQTVTGIDPPNRPFAVFTFLYRGEKQLQKMGVIPTAAKVVQKPVSGKGKRRSLQDDLSNLKPLNSNGLKNFSEMRDPHAARAKDRRNSKAKPTLDTSLESDDEDGDGAAGTGANKAIDGDDATKPSTAKSAAELSPEDIRRQREIADGLQKIRLKRQHSADQLQGSSIGTGTTSKAACLSPPPAGLSTPALSSIAAPHAPSPSSSSRRPTQLNPGPLLPSVAFDATSLLPNSNAEENTSLSSPFTSGLQTDNSTIISSTTPTQPMFMHAHSNSNSMGINSPSTVAESPMKKARASLSSADEDLMRKRFGVGAGISNEQGPTKFPTAGTPAADVMGAIENDRMNGRGEFFGAGNEAGTSAGATTSVADNSRADFGQHLLGQVLKGFNGAGASTPVSVPGKKLDDMMEEEEEL